MTARRTLPDKDAAWRWVEAEYGPFGHLSPTWSTLAVLCDLAGRLEALEARVAELEARRGRALARARKEQR